MGHVENHRAEKNLHGTFVASRLPDRLRGGLSLPKAWKEQLGIRHVRLLLCQDMAALLDTIAEGSYKLPPCDSLEGVGHELQRLHKFWMYFWV